jgi:hypothetical protein
MTNFNINIKVKYLEDNFKGMANIKIIIWYMKDNLNKVEFKEKEHIVLSNKIIRIKIMVIFIVEI